MGCLEQGNPLTFRLGGEGVLCVIGRLGSGIGFWVPGVEGFLGGGHLLPHGAHLLGGLLQ